MKRKNLRIYKDDFIRLYKEGKSLRSIGEFYGVSKASVKRYIEEDMELRQRGLSDKDKENSKKMFLSGSTVYEISKALNLDFSTVKNYLSKEFGAVTRGERKYEHLVPEIVRLYKKGYSSIKISKILGIGHQTVANYIAEERNVKTRTYSETSRVYKLNENAFDTTTNENAYILGLIFCRSRIDTNGSAIYVNISMPKDKAYLLDTISQFLYDGEYPKKNIIDSTYHIRVSSKKIVDRLTELGLPRNNIKANTTTNLDYLSSFKKDFFEGYFLANTSIKPRNIRISYLKEFVPFLKDYLELDLGVSNIRYMGNSIVLEKKSEVKKLLDAHNNIRNKIIEYINNATTENQHSWNTLIHHFK